MSEPFRLKRRDVADRLAYLAARRQEYVDQGATPEWLAGFDAMTEATAAGDPVWVAWPKVQAAFAGLGIAVGDDTARVVIEADQITVTRVRDGGQFEDTEILVRYEVGAS